MVSISKCEEEILKMISELNPDSATLRQITDKVNSQYGHDWKIQTVSTFLNRLVKKKMLYSQRIGNSSYYISTISWEEYQMQGLK